MSHADAAQEEVKPDMTPMIDCVFLLIVFFVCIDFRVLEAKLPAYLPKDKGGGPSSLEPQEQLSVKICCTNLGTPEPRIPGQAGRDPVTGRLHPYRLVGHGFYWQVGPERIDTSDALQQRLTGICADRRTWQIDAANGESKPMPVVVEPYPGSCYDDVARTVDVVKAAGFQEVNFGGGMGARR